MHLTAEETWKSCLNRFADEVAPQIFKTWFEPIRPMSLSRTDNGYQLRLGVPSQFFYEWIETRFNRLLTKTVDNVVGRSTEISFLIDSSMGDDDVPPSDVDDLRQRQAAKPSQAPREPAAQNGARGAVAPNITETRTAGAAAQIGNGSATFGSIPAHSHTARTTRYVPGVTSPPAPRRPPELNRSYSFDRLIEGDCNRLARSAALAIAERPGATSFNPFLVYGGVGLGKTHLIQAIGNYALQAGMTDGILYISSERFTSLFVQAIQQNRIGEFARRFREVKMLIIDDIQFFSGKEKTQEEFFHLFNDLHQKHRQIILSCDRPPKDIDGIEERLLSRFHWGLVADVQPPDLETRIAILRRKAQAENVKLQPGVAEFVAERIKTNVRKLEGALIRLIAHASLHNRTIDLPFAREILRDLLEEKPTQIDIEEIKRRVADYYDVSLDLLSAKTRRREIVQARHTAMYFCKQLTGQPLKTIGLRFGGRDHSTVIHACKAVEDRFDTDPTFRKELDEVQTKLQSRSLVN
ncbi:MAG: chromosomal replication initiator protein DnaA [Rhodothermia bacterium]|nr:chromosomal replication initiator protein DnaA [Rhodothermia bacterium]